MKKYGVAIIGCGCASGLHLSAVAASKKAKLVGVADLVLSRAKEIAGQFRAEVATQDYRELITRDDVEIVIVCTWPSSHTRIAIESMKRGKHVLCEKPLAPTLKEARKIIDAVKATGRKLKVGYILRFNAAYRRIAKMISDGAIGSPIIMRMSGAEHTISRRHWEEDQALIRETSPIIDCGCHYVDVMRWVTGAEAVCVSGVGLRVEEETPKDKYDWGIILVEMSDGSRGYYEVGWGHNFRNFSEKEFIGPKGRIRLIYAGHRIEHKEEGDMIEYYSYPGHYKAINVAGAWKRAEVQFQELVDDIEKDRSPLPALKDALKSLEIVLAGDRAIKEGTTVTLK